MPQDSLVKVFEKVGLKGIASDIPFVCKSWHKASLDPLCWRFLDFPSHTCTEDLKLAVDRSRGLAIHVKFPLTISLEGLAYVAEKCPALESVILASFDLECECLDVCVCDDNLRNALSSLVTQWKDLKFVSLCTMIPYFREILAQVRLHCTELVGLTILDGICLEQDFQDISMLSNIKYLKIFTTTDIERDGLILLLGGCKQLEELDVCGCVGFDPDDEEIMKMASHIKLFKAEGSNPCLSVEEWDMFYSDFTCEEADILAIASLISEVE